MFLAYATQIRNNDESSLRRGFSGGHRRRRHRTEREREHAAGDKGKPVFHPKDTTGKPEHHRGDADTAAADGNKF